MELTNTNPVKQSLRDGKKVCAAWAQAASNITAEVLADAGFDIVMVDMEHGPGDILTLISQIQAMKGNAAVPFVRAPWNDFVMIKKILDAGAYGLLVPYVNNLEQAKAAVKAVKYPTQGIRGVSGSPRGPHFGNKSLDYMKKANEEIFLMTAIETPEAVANIDELLSVDDIDGIFIGPMDLATSMGHFGNPSHPEVKKTIEKIENKVFSSNKVLATVGGTWDQAIEKYEKGYQILMLMSDTTSLSSFARKLTEDFFKQFPNR
ncbi:MAG: 2,4-dihydroxyhept-2-ene-1,7-dioic acid aldolase [Spirochaetia bacterium]|nr:2,4-dihydroxyhept-2-ene-1,7-dioic acid aldolase [Spirochaetia bacterium]